MTSLIQLRDVTKTYGTGSAAFRALRGVDLEGEMGNHGGPSLFGSSVALGAVNSVWKPGIVVRNSAIVETESLTGEKAVAIVPDRELETHRPPLRSSNRLDQRQLLSALAESIDLCPPKPTRSVGPLSLKCMPHLIPWRA